MSKQIAALHGQTRAPFDYSTIADPTLQTTLAQAGERIRRIQQAALIDVGTELCRVKAHLDHGQFRAWLFAETDLSAATANRLMQVAQNIGHDKWLTVRHLPAGMIYQLASPSTPAAVLETLAAVPAGQMVSLHEVKHLIITTRNSEHREEAKAKRKAAKVDPVASAKEQQAAEREAKRLEKWEAEEHTKRVHAYRHALWALEEIEQPLGADLTKVAKFVKEAGALAFYHALCTDAGEDAGYTSPRDNAALAAAIEERNAKQQAA